MADTGKKKQQEPKIPSKSNGTKSAGSSKSANGTKSTGAAKGGASKPAGKSQPAKKTQPAKKQAEETTEYKGMNKQTAAIIFAAAAVFLFAVAVIEGENVWNVMHNLMFRILGICAYVIPFMFLYMAIVYAREKQSANVSTNLISAGAVILMLSSAVHIFKGKLTDTVSIQISDAWSITPNKSGGVIGALIGGGIAKLFGETGAKITIILLLIVAILLLTGISLPIIVSFVRKPIKKVTQVTAERMEQNAQRREEERRQRELEEEQEENGEEEADKPVKEKPEKKKIPEIGGPATVTGDLIEPPMPVIINGTGPAAAVAPAVAAGIGEAASAVTAAETVADKKAKKPKAPKVKDALIIEKKPEPKKKTPAAAAEPVSQSSDNYKLPPIDCLNLPVSTGAVDPEDEMQSGSRKLIETLESFKIHATVTAIVRGPSVTRYELVPEAGIRINRITALSDDIALRLAAKSVRIEAPIPGKAAIGIEVPNSSKSAVTMREVIDTDVYRAGAAKSKLNVALGKDITGNIITADLAKMPHLLVAGTTGSGKSVCLNSMIISILYNAKPDEVKLLMIDPKMVEFTVYNGISHLEVPVVSNPRKAAGALAWAVSEMEKRYKMFSENKVRDIKGYNNLCEGNDELVKMHHIVIFIDELSDLMMASPKEVEDSICRLAQMARAAGIHMVIATQRPSVDVITGIIKANIPSRIALFVSSQVDSRTIIDQSGAEKLLGNGDMLFNPVGSSKPHRVQGCYISDEEVERVVRHIAMQCPANYNDETIREIDAKAAATESKKGYDADDDENALDPMFDQAAEAVITAGQASTTMLQKKLKLGYARASRVMDQLEERGIVGPSEGAKPRQVLLSKNEWYEMQALAEGGSSANKDVQLEFNTAELNSADEYEEDIPGEDIPFEEDEEEADGFADIYEEEEDEEDTDDFIDEVPAEIVTDETEEIFEEAEEFEDEAAEEDYFEEEIEEEYIDDGPDDNGVMPGNIIEFEILKPDNGADSAKPAAEEPETEAEADSPDEKPVEEELIEEEIIEEEYYEDFDDASPVPMDDVFADDDFYDDDEDIDSFFN